MERTKKWTKKTDAHLETNQDLRSGPITARLWRTRERLKTFASVNRVTGIRNREKRQGIWEKWKANWDISTARIKTGEREREGGGSARFAAPGGGAQHRLFAGSRRVARRRQEPAAGACHGGARSPPEAAAGARHASGRSPQPARVSRARSGARWRQEPATGTRGARRRQEPAAGTAALGTRSGHQEGIGNRGGDAILSADGWIGPGHASVGGAAGKESWEGRRRDWRAELDAVRERVQRAGMEEGAVTKEKNRDLWQKYFS